MCYSILPLNFQTESNVWSYFPFITPESLSLVLKPKRVQSQPPLADDGAESSLRKAREAGAWVSTTHVFHVLVHQQVLTRCNVHGKIVVSNCSLQNSQNSQYFATESIIRNVLNDSTYNIVEKCNMCKRYVHDRFFAKPTTAFPLAHSTVVLATINTLCSTAWLGKGDSQDIQRVAARYKKRGSAG